MLYNPASGAWSWTNSTAINYALHAVKERYDLQPEAAEDVEDHSRATSSWAKELDWGERDTETISRVLEVWRAANETARVNPHRPLHQRYVIRESSFLLRALLIQLCIAAWNALWSVSKSATVKSRIFIWPQYLDNKYAFQPHAGKSPPCPPLFFFPIEKKYSYFLWDDNGSHVKALYNSKQACGTGHGISLARLDWWCSSS